ncbi:MAG: hypothetical protein H7141_01320, partial [Burkholderiales bacterium]|nr:hypothetical protein [Bacteroidia bacterium]
MKKFYNFSVHKISSLCLSIISCFSLFNSHNSKAQVTGYNWNSVAIGGGGFVSALITSKTEKNLIYARTDVGGAYRWNATT